MKKSVSPALAVALIVVVVAVAAYFVYQGTGPHRESSPLSQEEIYNQMKTFNKTGKAPSNGAPPQAPAPTGR
jgi:hypothetical protein